MKYWKCSLVLYSAIKSLCRLNICRNKANSTEQVFLQTNTNRHSGSYNVIDFLYGSRMTFKESYSLTSGKRLVNSFPNQDQITHSNSYSIKNYILYFVCFVHFTKHRSSTTKNKLKSSDKLLGYTLIAFLISV